jgi:hypothetical protein
MGHTLAGALMPGIPLIYIAIVSIRYFYLWKNQIITARKTLMPTLPKAEDTIFSAIENVRRSLIILLISACAVVLYLILHAGLLPITSHDSVASFITVVYQDLLLPVFFCLAALPTTIKIFQRKQNVKWNNAMEDIEENVVKSMSILTSNND